MNKTRITVVIGKVSSAHDFEALCIQSALTALGWEFVGLVGDGL